LPQHQDFNGHACYTGRSQGSHDPENEGAGEYRNSCSHIGPDHIEGTMGKIDHLHDAKYQRQTGRHKKQGNTKLQPVEKLFDK